MGRRWASIALWWRHGLLGALVAGLLLSGPVAAPPDWPAAVALAALALAALRSLGLRTGAFEAGGLPPPGALWLTLASATAVLAGIGLGDARRSAIAAGAGPGAAGAAVELSGTLATGPKISAGELRVPLQTDAGRYLLTTPRTDLERSCSRKGKPRTHLQRRWRENLSPQEVGRHESGRRCSLKQMLPQLADTQAFEEFYRRMYPGVLRMVGRRVLDPELALDITAETFARVVLKRRQFKGGTSAELEAWVFQIAKREVGRYVARLRLERRATRRLGIELPAPSDMELQRVLELSEVEPLRAQLAIALRSLSRQQREAIQLRVLDEMSYSEIANRLAISEDAARARVARALAVLARRTRFHRDSPLANGGET